MIQEANKYGGKCSTDHDFNNFRTRNNTKANSFLEGGSFLGLINAEEEPQGPYSDLSIVLFPDEQENQPWLLCLGVGSLGFKNDYQIASMPGLRRMFSRLVSKNNGYIKTSFLDIENPLPKYFLEKVPRLKNSLNKNDYKKLLPVCEIIENPLDDHGKSKISAFIAVFAYWKEWASNKTQRDEINKVIQIGLEDNNTDDYKKVIELLTERKFVVLTGAPGTGKTRLAKIIAKEDFDKPFFIQFHAETDYSDFIYGIRPKIDSGNLSYESKEGIFSKAIDYAINNPSKRTLLIIDEINRANLSNILGPIFYLFEYKISDDEGEQIVEINNRLKVSMIPKNFFVVATMNTADRSLAVVDFALRRRFAWYEIKPHRIEKPNFFKDDFGRIQDIFIKYADSEELSLMPGQGYFIADSERIMKMRLEYELLPLIKEYLLEGFLQKAKEAFNIYFIERIEKSLYE